MNRQLAIAIGVSPAKKGKKKKAKASFYRVQETPPPGIR